jgi:murein DD-endopeptidase MepM/ murein hydrolase activator NlpD
MSRKERHQQDETGRILPRMSIRPAVALPRPVIRSSPGPAAARAWRRDDHGRMLRLAALVVVGAAATGVVGAPAPFWTWPTASHLVERGSEAPATPYTAGHRGIDVAAEEGDAVRAVDDGVVAFAGVVVDRGVVAIDHDGVRSTVEPVDPAVHAGEAVRRGEVIGHLAEGGPHAPGTLHLGARVRVGEGWAYVSPLLYLGGATRAVLLPLSAWPG